MKTNIALLLVVVALLAPEAAATSRLFQKRQPTAEPPVELQEEESEEDISEPAVIENGGSNSKNRSHKDKARETSATQRASNYDAMWKKYHKKAEEKAPECEDDAPDGS